MGTLNYGINPNLQIGIDYTIDDQTKGTSSTTTSSTPILDALFIIHASQGIPNKVFKKLTAGNFQALFGDITDKHGMQALACKRHLDLGLTASVIRVDEGGSIANVFPKIKFAPKEAEVYAYAGKLFNVSDTQVTDGTFDSVLEAFDITSTTFLTKAKKVTVPVLEGIVTYDSITGADDEDSLLTEMGALYTEATGGFGIKTRTVVPGAFHSPGAGKYGNKIKITFGDATTIRNGIQTKSVIVTNTSTEKSTTYSSMSLVPDKLDENEIALYMSDKLKDKVVINDYKGDLNVRWSVDNINKNGFDEVMIEYFNALVEYCSTKMTDNDALLLAGDVNNPGDPELSTALASVIITYTSILEQLETGDIHPFQMIGFDGNAIYGSTYGAHSFNLIKLSSSLFPTSFYLQNGDDGIVKNMRKFSYDKENEAKTRTVADLYIDVFTGLTDPDILDYTEVESVLTYDVDYPKKVRDAMRKFIAHGVNTRGEIVGIGGMPTTIADYDSALEYGKTVRGDDAKYFMAAPNAEIYDTNLYKTYRVNTAFLMIDALASWFNGDRKSPVTDYALNPNIRDGSLRPKVIETAKQNELYTYDINLIKKVDGVYKLRTQAMQMYGKISKLKELHNQINFCYLIKETHFSLERNNSETGLNSIKEKISKDLAVFSKYFDQAPTVTLNYADDDAAARGEAQLGIVVYMSGTVKKFDITFTVKSSTSSSS